MKWSLAAIALEAKYAVLGVVACAGVVLVVLFCVVVFICRGLNDWIGEKNATE